MRAAENGAAPAIEMPELLLGRLRIRLCGSLNGALALVVLWVELALGR